MNILKQCTFFDRNRNAEVDLDDIIEEKYVQTGKNIKSENQLYLLLYFNADWLPENSNRMINSKLEYFCSHKKLNKKFEIIFVSSDKTRDENNKFLSNNKFIRYYLAFHENDLKDQLVKYLNINGIPYLKIIKLNLDQNIKLIDYKIDSSNAKQMVLTDKSGKKFPWANFNSLHNNKNDIYNLNDSSAAIQNNQTKQIKNLSINNDLLSKESSNDMLNMITSNMLPFDSQQTFSYTPYPDTNFLFMVIGSNKSKLTQVYLQGLAEFWTKFHSKYKFKVVYLNSEEKEIDKSISKIVFNLEWFFFNGDIILKNKINEFYGMKTLKQYPKLLVIDAESGQSINENVKLALLEYVHEFCTRQTEMANCLKQNHHKKDDDFTFDYDVYDLCNFINGNTKHDCNNSKKVKQKILNQDLLSELIKNLVDISKTKNEKTDKSSSFYLLYFCSNFITSNENMFKSVASFIYLIGEKFNCKLKLILVSSDTNKFEYEKLLAKFHLDFDTNKNQSTHFALDFEAAKIKQVLFKELGVTGIPWLTLINSRNGEVMSENLRNIILNSKLNSVQI